MYFIFFSSSSQNCYKLVQPQFTVLLKDWQDEIPIYMLQNRSGKLIKAACLGLKNLGFKTKKKKPNPKLAFAKLAFSL